MRLSDIQQAFVDETAIQCGFCSPGFIMTSYEILESGKEYTDDELLQAPVRPPVPLHRV